MSSAEEGVMSRIRTIKPEILEDAITAGLSDMAFRLFVSVIVLADDYGRLRAEPGWLMGQIYWARSATISVETFLEAMRELTRLVNWYEVNGQRYAEIRNWAKHQRVDKPGKPRIPTPSEPALESSRESRESVANVSGDPRESLAPDLGSRTIGPPTVTVVANATSGTVTGAESEPETKPRPRRLGSRLAPDWTPSAETVAWARDAGFADPLRHLAEFRDYWVAQPGARGTKADWDATYRNRLRQIADRGKAGGPVVRRESREQAKAFAEQLAAVVRAAGGG